MAYSDHFRNITRRRLVFSVLAGVISGLLLEILLLALGVKDHMPFVLLGICAILLLVILDWLDFSFRILVR